MRNVTSSLISEVCKDVQAEPQLQLWTGEPFAPSTVTGNEIRLDVCARGFWQGSQMAFFDVRVFNPSARRYAKQELSKTYKLNKKEKKRLHNERITQVEHGTFTPLVMSATEWIGPQWIEVSFMAVGVDKWEKMMDTTENYICINCFNGMCLRGSRSVFHREKLEQSINFLVNFHRKFKIS